MQTKQGEIYRYSDKELEEFKDLLLIKKEKATTELAFMQGIMTKKDDNGYEDSGNLYKNLEDGSGSMDREHLAQMISRQIDFINCLDKALARIENKSYGICRVTGKLIDKARLKAVPHATLSIEAKTQLNKDKK